MVDGFLWWLALALIGWAAFPLGFFFFRWLPDRGYAFARVFGLLALSYTLWIGGTIHVLPFYRGTIIGLLAAMALAAAWLVRTRPEIRTFLREKWAYIAAVEVLFVAMFAGGLWLRAFTPEISFGEKTADLAFINGILRSHYFPPNDPWLSGGKIHWYYFGHLNVAMLTDLTGIPSRITFNLAGVSMLGLGGIAVFGLVYNLLAGQARLRRIFAFGVLAVVFLLVLANIEGLFEMTAAHGIGPNWFYGLVGVTGLDGPRHTSQWYPSEWWWIGRAVTLAPRDLREFPFFSFLTGDLHAHMMAVPFNFLAVAAVLNLWRSDLPLDQSFWRRHPVLLAVSGVTVGAVGFVELWDLAAILLLVAALAVAWNYWRARRLGWSLVVEAAGFMVPLALLSVLAFLPFYLGLKSISEGIQPIEVRHLQIQGVSTATTRPQHFVYAWLPYTWLVLAFGWVTVAATASLRSPLEGSGSGWASRLRTVAIASSLALLPLVAWSAAVLLKRGPAGFFQEVADRNASWVTGAILVTLISLMTLAYVRLAAAWEDEVKRRVLFVVTLCGAAFFLVWGAELFWVEDPYGTRFNTLFRLGYQAWLFLSVGTACALFYVLRDWRVPALSLRVSKPSWADALRPGPGASRVRRLVVRVAALPLAGAATVASAAVAVVRLLVQVSKPARAAKYAWAGLAAAIVVAALVYTPPAMFWRANNFNNPQSLDGMVLVKRYNTPEYEAVNWLDKAVEGNAVILEGVGDDYHDDQGSVSARTGLQTLLSWPGHEERWRGSRAAFAGRAEAVETFYKTTDVNQAKAILAEYRVEYVYVGRFERDKYGEGGLGKLDGFLEVLYRKDNVTIYRVPDGVRALVESP
ncbi:MAG TPA: DUF2298 domain-containing protein [Dehalococcoidia bacterium]|nr:DUF2298 domain-containing protein [Dehalococcoidia bacterium]